MSQKDYDATTGNFGGGESPLSYDEAFAGVTRISVLTSDPYLVVIREIEFWESIDG